MEVVAQAGTVAEGRRKIAEGGIDAAFAGRADHGGASPKRPATILKGYRLRFSGLVTAPSDEEETRTAYFAMTPVE